MKASMQQANFSNITSIMHDLLPISGLHISPGSCNDRPCSWVQPSGKSFGSGDLQCGLHMPQSTLEC